MRKAGEDVKAGEAVLAAGAVLRPQDLAALASIGVAEVDCFRGCGSAIVSTGDEVVRGAAGRRWRRGRCTTPTRRCCRPLIAGAGAVATDLGVLPDNLAQVKQRLARGGEASST